MQRSYSIQPYVSSSAYSALPSASGSSSYTNPAYAVSSSSSSYHVPATTASPNPQPRLIHSHSHRSLTQQQQYQLQPQYQSPQQQQQQTYSPARSSPMQRSFSLYAPTSRSYTQPIYSAYDPNTNIAIRPDSTTSPINPVPQLVYYAPVIVHQNSPITHQNSPIARPTNPTALEAATTTSSPSNTPASPVIKTPTRRSISGVSTALLPPDIRKQLTPQQSNRATELRFETQSEPQSPRTELNSTADSPSRSARTRPIARTGPREALESIRHQSEAHQRLRNSTVSELLEQSAHFRAKNQLRRDQESLLLAEMASVSSQSIAE